jgi:hypothetical protein
VRRSVRSVEVGDHVTPLKRHFVVITDDPSTADAGTRLVTFLQEVLAMPSLLTCGPVATPQYSISHDGEKWTLRGEGESAN